jgi:membrane protein
MRNQECNLVTFIFVHPRFKHTAADSILRPADTFVPRTFAASARQLAQYIANTDRPQRSVFRFVLLSDWAIWLWMKRLLSPIRHLRRLSAILAGWPVVGVIVRAVRRTMAREVMLFAGGVSFFTLLALFPAIAVIASVYGLMFSIDDAQAQIARFAGILPQSAQDFAFDQIARIAVASNTSLSIQGGIALLISLFAAARGAKALIAGLNQIARVGDLRNIFKFNLVAMGVVFLGGLLVVMSNVVILTIPVIIRPILRWLGFAELDLGTLFNEWTVSATAMIIALALMYRFVMRRAGEVSWMASLIGAGISTAAWLGISAAFSFYVSSIVHPSAYGSLGALVVFLLWIYWGAYAVFFGAALAIEVDHQGRRHENERADPPD